MHTNHNASHTETLPWHDGYFSLWKASLSPINVLIIVKMFDRGSLLRKLSHYFCVVSRARLVCGLVNQFLNRKWSRAHENQLWTVEETDLSPVTALLLESQDVRMASWLALDRVRVLQTADLRSRAVVVVEDKQGGICHYTWLSYSGSNRWNWNLSCQSLYYITIVRKQI